MEEPTKILLYKEDNKLVTAQVVQLDSLQELKAQAILLQQLLNNLELRVEVHHPILVMELPMEILEIIDMEVDSSDFIQIYHEFINKLTYHQEITNQRLMFTTG